MIAGLHPIVQSLLGTLLTWGLTAAGAALVFIFQGGAKEQRKILDGSLGFAAGVMLAASYWSLLAPAIEMAEESHIYGAFVFVPVSVGFAAGAVFVYLADILLPILGVQTGSVAVAAYGIEKKMELSRRKHDSMSDAEEGETWEQVGGVDGIEPSPFVRSRKRSSSSSESHGVLSLSRDTETQATNWRRILLLIVAITVHNIPEGLAVGVGFGAIGKSSSATLESARNLALGIGIQNFPEGLAVSLPLKASGLDTWKSFWYGQLSGMVEPLAGLFGAAAVVIAEPLLPYALSFAAGAMVYVVVDDIIPEAYSCGNGRLASVGAIVGFIVMMSLDVGLG